MLAKPKKPRFKVARHLGENVYNHPKALKRGIKPRRKQSEYGKQLLEKQKLDVYKRQVIDQIRTIDKRRIVKILGKLNNPEIEKVKDVIQETFVE